MWLIGGSSFKNILSVLFIIQMLESLKNQRQGTYLHIDQTKGDLSGLLEGGTADITFI